MKNSLFIGLLFFLLVGCEKNTIEKAPINGIWVETTQKMDTLVFDNQHPSFNLKRGSELRNGYLLPKLSSGLYSYEIGKDSISLNWILSSSSYRNNYYFFKLDTESDLIEIGNFFVDSLNKNVTLTFSRIP
jgi:hypothetical protein